MGVEMTFFGLKYLFRIGGTVQHTPTKNSQEAPLPPPPEWLYKILKVMPETRNHCLQVACNSQCLKDKKSKWSTNLLQSQDET